MSVIAGVSTSTTQHPESEAAAGICTDGRTDRLAATTGPIVHLTSSRFFGGPERQMLGLARALSSELETVFVSFSEGGRCADFLDRVQSAGFDSYDLQNDTPWLFAAYRELRGLLRNVKAEVLCCHGYKAGMIGLRAARAESIPVIAVSRGWTAESPKVRLYEVLDRRCLRHMDRVVCVSHAQAEKVVGSGVCRDRVIVIHNAIDVDRFHRPQSPQAADLRQLFPRLPRFLVGAAGRLSPEKGFSVLIEAAEKVIAAEPSAGFIIFGDGPLKEQLTAQIAERDLGTHVVLGGFRTDLDSVLPQLDLFVLPSYTEGLPNVILEAFAAEVPVVATAVGGTPELVEEGENGFLVPAGDAPAMARRILDVIQRGAGRRELGRNGRERVISGFGFEAQADQYRKLFASLERDRCGPPLHACRGPVACR